MKTLWKRLWGRASEQLQDKLANFGISVSLALVMGAWWAILAIALIETFTE
jgi:hypothetical protein